MLDSVGMHRGVKEYRRLVAAFERIFGAIIFFGTDTVPIAKLELDENIEFAYPL